MMEGFDPDAEPYFNLELLEGGSYEAATAVLTQLGFVEPEPGLIPNSDMNSCASLTKSGAEAKLKQAVASVVKRKGECSSERALDVLAETAAEYMSYFFRVMRIRVDNGEYDALTPHLVNTALRDLGLKGFLSLRDYMESQE